MKRIIRYLRLRRERNFRLFCLKYARKACKGTGNSVADEARRIYWFLTEGYE